MKRGLSREQLSAYQGAVEAVLAVPISVGFGYWVDRSFDTSPVGVGVGAVIGFAALVLRITRMRPDGETDESDETDAERQRKENERRD